MARLARRERPRVLLVEDHTAIREALTDLLTHSGYEVVAARSLHEATGCLGTHYGAYDVVIVDLMLGDGNGADLIVAIRSIPYATRPRVVVCSAAERHGSAIRRAIEAGADAVHYKPIAFGDETDGPGGAVTRGGLLSVIRGTHPGDVEIPGISVVPAS